MLKQRNLDLPVTIVLAAAFIVPAGAAAQDQPRDPAADSAVYTLDRASRLLVHAGKSGLLKGFGHEHQVRAHAFSGTVVYFPQEIGRSRVWVTVRTDSLLVVPEADSADIPEITRTMREKTLLVDSFPEITFASRDIVVIGAAGAAGAAEAAEAAAAAGAAGAAGAAERQVVRVSGDLTMVGVTRPVTVDLRLEVSADTLRAEGSFTVKQTDYGISPYGKFLGLVKVRDEVRFELRVLARRSTNLHGGLTRTFGSVR